MPASVVKILVHGADIVSGIIMPVGQFSEEAKESRNRKYLEEFIGKKYLGHQRKVMFSIYFWFPPVHLPRV
jgi:hypothetical protein